MKSCQRIFAFLAVWTVVLLATRATFAAETSDAVNQAKKRVSDADAQVRKAMAGVTIEATRIAKALEVTAPYVQASGDLKAAQAKFVKASGKVKAALAADPAYKKAVAERTRLQEEKERVRSDPGATPEQRTQVAVDTLKAAAEVGKLEQQAMEDDGEVAKAKAAITQAQYTLDELKRSALANAAQDPALLAAKQKVDSAKVQLVDAEKQLGDAKKQQARLNEQKMADEAQKAQDAVFDPSRRR
jgi:putative ABC transport system permease protein